jgi:hypothetical protein
VSTAERKTGLKARDVETVWLVSDERGWNIVACGTVVTNSVITGEGSGPNTYELISSTGLSIARLAP